MSSLLIRSGVVASLILAGCTPSRKEVRTDIVRRVRFVGNGGLFSGNNGLQLRRAMVQKQSPPLTFTFPFMYFTQPVTLSLDSLRADGRRLEIWYAHHGWFDAHVDGWEIRRVRQDSDKRAGVVDLIGHVVPGQASVIRTYSVTGNWDAAAAAVIRQARRDSPITTGEQFDLDTVRAAQKRIVEELQDHGYAYATSELTVDAYPEEHEVDLTVLVTPGIVSRFGELRVHGLERVDEVAVRSTVDIEAGRPFRLSELRDAQARLFETNLFSLVDLAPDLSDPTDPTVPIDVTLTEAKLRRFRVGAGVNFDYFTVSPKLSLGFRDLHLFGTGVQLDADASLGAIIGVVRDDQGLGGDFLLTGLGGLEFDYPWWMGGRLGLTVGGEFKQDAQFGTLPYWKTTANVALRYRFNRYATLSGGPVFEWFRYLEPSAETLEAARLQFGGDFSGADYRLLALDVRFVLDYRDDPIRTRSGTFWNLAVRQSIPIPAFDTAGAANDGVPGKGFLYSRVEGEVRAFSPLRFSRRQTSFPFVVAGRLHAIGLLPWTAGDALPYPDLAFLGGPNSLRGFRTDQVGAYDLICSYRYGRPNPQHNNGETYDLTRTYLPRGGAFAAEASAEVRYDWKYGVSFAVFGDAGLLANRWPDTSADKIRAGGGVGMRFDSPVGPIRLDVGLRPVYPEDISPARYIGCNPIDRLPRGFDLFTGATRVRENLPGRQFPLAINLFLAIGEAF
ncbi:MAG: BamA/TamA family outer membrane protein [Alphaproteobacteria bacterium]|nr:BamA/TamA family outer membrane protein [Alphaproteobacteria bacterium]